MKPATLTVLLHVLALSLSATANVLRREKFTAWFPLISTRTFASISTDECNGTLADYRTAFREEANPTELATVCSFHQQCIIRNLREDIAARLQSANVLLGLTPVLLGQMGPSVAEISQLSRERPILSLLLSFGSPAVFIDRVLKYKGATEVLNDNHAQITSFSWLKSRFWQLFITVAQYILVAAAFGNVIQASLELGMRTTISFSCNNWYLPLVWTLTSFLVYLPAAVNWDPLVRFVFRLVQRVFPVFGENPEPQQPQQPQKPQQPEQPERLQQPQTDENLFIAVLKKEASLCLVHEKSGRAHETQSVANVVMNYVATFIGFLHVMFGTLIFSSVTFIELIDVLAVILRYMASAVVCRAVLSFELAGIRQVVSKNEQHRTEATGYGSIEMDPLRRQDCSSAQISQMPSTWEEETAR